MTGKSGADRAAASLVFVLAVGTQIFPSAEVCGGVRRMWRSISGLLHVEKWPRTRVQY